MTSSHPNLPLLDFTTTYFTPLWNANPDPTGDTIWIIYTNLMSVKAHIKTNAIVRDSLATACTHLLENDNARHIPTLPRGQFFLMRAMALDEEGNEEQAMEAAGQAMMCFRKVKEALGKDEDMGEVAGAMDAAIGVCEDLIESLKPKDDVGDENIESFAEQDAKTEW